jgi:hypothetical protein
MNQGAMNSNIEDEDDIAAAYDLLNQRSAPSTVAGRESVLGHFSNFFNAVNLPEELTESQSL